MLRPCAQAGTGDIVVTPSGGNSNSTAVEIPAGDSQVVFNGLSVTISPMSGLDDRGGKTHTVTMASGVLKDVASNDFGGIAGMTYAFTLADTTAPVVISGGYSPVLQAVWLSPLTLSP